MSNPQHPSATSTTLVRGVPASARFCHVPAYHSSVDPGSCRTVFDCHRNIMSHFERQRSESGGGGGDGGGAGGDAGGGGAVSVDERNYYLDTAHLLFDYYNQSSASVATEGEARATPAPQKGRGRPRARKRGGGKMLSFLQKMADQQRGYKAGAAANPGDAAAGAPPLPPACAPGMALTDIIERYNQCVDPVATVPSTDPRADPLQVCADCGAEGCCVLMEADSTIQCTKCGSCTYSPMLQSTPSFQMATRTARPTFTLYKRANHFNEWISQFQAKESISVPDDVYSAIVAELAKRGPHWRSCKITTSSLRVLLRKLKFNKYYEHIPRIIHRLQGTPPPTISREVEEKLRTMFRMIQEPFMKHSPPTRRNFLQYSYVLHKFMGILGLRELQKSFPLLKSRSKSYAQDLIWRKICKDVGFPYEPSI